MIGYVMVATLCARKTQPRIGGTVTIRHVDAPIIIGLVELAGGRIAAKEGSKAPLVVARLPGNPKSEYASALASVWCFAEGLKSELIALLSAPAEVRERKVAAALLRENLFRNVDGPCRFFYGLAGGPCLRCGNSWNGHFGTRAIIAGQPLQSIDPTLVKPHATFRDRRYRSGRAMTVRRDLA